MVDTEEGVIVTQQLLCCVPGWKWQKLVESQAHEQFQGDVGRSAALQSFPSVLCLQSADGEQTGLVLYIRSSGKHLNSNVIRNATEYRIHPI